MLAFEKQEQSHNGIAGQTRLNFLDFFNRFSQIIDVVFCTVQGTFCLASFQKGFEVQMVQWKSSSTMIVAGSNPPHHRFPCVTANTSSVLTQQKQQSIWDKPQIQRTYSAARAPSTDVI